MTSFTRAPQTVCAGKTLDNPCHPLYQKGSGLSTQATPVSRSKLKFLQKSQKTAINQTKFLIKLWFSQKVKFCQCSLKSEKYWMSKFLYALNEINMGVSFILRVICDRSLMSWENQVFEAKIGAYLSIKAQVSLRHQWCSKWEKTASKFVIFQHNSIFSMYKWSIVSCYWEWNNLIWTIDKHSFKFSLFNIEKIDFFRKNDKKFRLAYCYFLTSEV